jgi:hypothetical protein
LPPRNLSITRKTYVILKARRKGEVILDTDEIKGLLENAVISVRKRPPIKRRDDVSYALVVKAGYEEILKLREDDYSYDVICEVFAENGLFPNGANPKTFRSAFIRETNRREKKLKTAIPKNTGVVQKAAAPAVKTDKPANGIAPKPKDNEASEKEWILKQTSTVVNTGLGKIIKHSDGSFDYD